jgi:hypothetical protein
MNGQTDFTAKAEPEDFKNTGQIRTHGSQQTILLFDHEPVPSPRSHASSGGIGSR